MHTLKARRRFAPLVPRPPVSPRFPFRVDLAYTEFQPEEPPEPPEPESPEHAAPEHAMKKIFMPLMTLALGVALNLVGILSYSLQEGERSFTALIPAFIGGVFLVLGGMALNTRFRKHTIHGALALDLILGAYCVYKVFWMLANLGDPSATVLKMFSFLTTAALCIGYLVLGVRSFIHARQARHDAEIAAKAAEKAEAAAEY